MDRVSILRLVDLADYLDYPAQLSAWNWICPTLDIYTKEDEHFLTSVAMTENRMYEIDGAEFDYVEDAAEYIKSLG